MKKAIANAGIVGLVLIGSAQSNLADSEISFANDKPYNVQSLSIKSNADAASSLISLPTFDRGTYEIVTVRPWLNSENASKQLSDKELVNLLRLVGFPEKSLAMAWAIVQKESTSRPYAHNNNKNTGDNSYGLFQINMRGSMGPDRRARYGLDSNEDLFDPVKNATVAYKMSDGGKDWSAWTTHKDAKKILGEYPY